MADLATHESAAAAPAISLARKLATLADALQPIAGFLADPKVVEVMVNPDGTVWVERLREFPVRQDVGFLPGAAERLARAIAALEGAELNAANPSLACAVPGAGQGARAQILIPPVVGAVTVVLRTHRSTVLPLSHYIDKGVLAPRYGRALERAVHSRKNILIAGGTGSGKTTFLNSVLGQLTGSPDRVLTIEDTPEIRCAVEHRVPVRVLKHLYSWRDAVTDAMRMRPDRIIVGEVKEGAAALELLTALNTGHPGSIATIHSDSATQALDRYARLIEQVVEHAPRVEIAGAFHVLAHLRKDDTSEAGRVVTEVLSVHGFVRAPLNPEERRRYERQGLTLAATEGGYWLVKDMEDL